MIFLLFYKINYKLKNLSKTHHTDKLISLSHLTIERTSKPFG